MIEHRPPACLARTAWHAVRTRRATPDPDWFDRPALSRLTFSSPELPAPFADLSAGDVARDWRSDNVGPKTVPSLLTAGGTGTLPP